MIRYSLKPVLAACLFAMFAAPSQAMVVNGSFEDLTGTGLSMNNWNVYKTIPGWTTDSGAGIELQRGNIGGANAFDGEVKVELDSHNAGSNSSMIQKLGLAAGDYVLSFAYMGRVEGNPDNTNQIDYSVIGTALSGSVSKAFGAWEVISAMFHTDGGGVTLRFAASGRQDTYGGYIDSVAISPAPVPLPAGLPLLGAAMLALGLVRRWSPKAL